MSEAVSLIIAHPSRFLYSQVITCVIVYEYQYLIEQLCASDCGVILLLSGLVASKPGPNKNNFIIFGPMVCIGTIIARHREINEIAVGVKGFVMNMKEFWRLIEVAHEQSDGDDERQASLLVSALVALGASAIIAFGTFYKRFVDMVTERVNVCSTDLCYSVRGELYLTTFGYWLVGQGESEYYRGLAANDAHDVEQVSDVGILGTPLEHVVPTAYYECTGQDHPDWLGFSEYLAAGSGTVEAGAYVSDCLDVTFQEMTLHDARESVLSECDKLDGGVFFLRCIMEGLYHHLPTWKQTTQSGILLANAYHLTCEFEKLVESKAPYNISNALKMLVPDEPLRAPEGPTHRSAAE